MFRNLRTVLRVAILVMLGWELLACALSLTLHIPFERFALGDLTIYFGAGLALARRSGLLSGPVGSAAIAAVDATVGWTITWLLGPGRPADGWSHPWAIVATSLGVVFLAALLGFGAGVVGEFFRLRPVADG
jgi:hypothetical protein